MSSIDEYFGLIEPDNKVEEKKEKTLAERSTSLGEGLLSLDKTSDYFEETYKKIESIAPEMTHEEMLDEAHHREQVNEDEMDYTMRCYSDRLSEIMNA